MANAKKTDSYCNENALQVLLVSREIEREYFNKDSTMKISKSLYYACSRSIAKLKPLDVERELIFENLQKEYKMSIGFDVEKASKDNDYVNNVNIRYKFWLEDGDNKKPLKDFLKEPCMIECHKIDASELDALEIYGDWLDIINNYMIKS